MPGDVVKVNGLLAALVGRTLLQLCVGPWDLQMRYDQGLAVQLEGDVRVGDAAPEPPYSLAGVTMLHALLSGDVEAASVSDDGCLSLMINGVSVRCLADPQYEAWNYNGPDGALVVCVGGGRLDVFDRRVT